ncbi:MAG: site-specific DNA-methyltransferase [Alphaproteobacteria bacterium]|jgi:adenine-specific DNA-methyltransferase|nr:site-specific DNA-methyltransferase [Alphaproteobacteria bacterium]
MSNQIFIGDNLEVMSSHSFKKYHNKIKMIYIDPPYNTKSNKSYLDNYCSINWSDFIKDRLSLTKDLLKEDGVIFISIDDNELVNLKIICEEIFGKSNFIGIFITQQSQRSNAKHINTVHEYILCFAKNKSRVPPFKISRLLLTKDKSIINSLYTEIRPIINKQGIDIASKEISKIINKLCKENNISWLKNYNRIDVNGKIFFPMDLSTPNNPREINIPEINLKLDALKNRGWATDQKFIDLYKNNRLFFRNGRPYEKKYIEESYDNAPSVLNFFSRQGTNDLKKLGLSGLFDTPKPVDLVKFLILIATGENDYILDFFAGSGTTAQAVYEVNAENNRSNNYILIQKNEKINASNSVYKACKTYNINPDISDILIYRLNHYLSVNNKQKDYVISQH